MMHSASGALFWSVSVLVLWVVVIGGSTWAAVRVLHRPLRQPPPSLPSPLEILERRFAAGEITRDDFDEARARLHEHQLDI